MRVLSVLIFLLIGLSSGSLHALEQNDPRLKTEITKLRRQLSRFDWQLVGQAYYSRSFSLAPFELQSISAPDEQETNPEFLSALNLTSDISVYYELTPQLRIVSVSENVVVPRLMSFSVKDDALMVSNGEGEFEMTYRIDFPADRPGIAFLYLNTILEKPSDSRIFGDLHFVNDELQLVQEFGNSKIAWIFKKVIPQN